MRNVEFNSEDVARFNQKLAFIIVIKIIDDTISMFLNEEEKKLVEYSVISPYGYYRYRFKTDTCISATHLLDLLVTNTEVIITLDTKNCNSLFTNSDRICFSIKDGVSDYSKHRIKKLVSRFCRLIKGDIDSWKVVTGEIEKYVWKS